MKTKEKEQAQHALNEGIDNQVKMLKEKIKSGTEA